MTHHSRSHLTDSALASELSVHAAHERGTCAEVLADIAEFDARKLYLPAAHPSMFSYCVYELGYSEDAAYKRIQAARIARVFPEIFDMVADGRLHLSGVCLLATHLTPANAGELLAAASSKTKSEIEHIIAECFPRTERLPMVVAVPLPSPERDVQLAPGQVGDRIAGDEVPAPMDELRQAETGVAAPGRVDRAFAVSPPGLPTMPPSRVAPVARERYCAEFMMDKEMHDDLRHAQSLLSHRVSPGDLSAVFRRALKALIVQLEKRKFGATTARGSEEFD